MRSADTTTRIDGWLATRFPADQPGAAVAIVQGGARTLRAAYGLADLETGAPLTPAHRFHIGSIGKQWTCLRIMQLRATGALEYDDPVGRALPQLAHLGAGVTIRRLMQHVSGIPDYYEDEALLARLVARTPTPDNRDMLALLQTTREMPSVPGTEFAYSNTGYEVLGSLIEAVTGVDYTQDLAANIFVPLGMAATFSLPHPRDNVEPPIARSYVPAESGWAAYDMDPLDGLLGAGSFYSTLDDMVRYHRAVDKGALLPSGHWDVAFQPAELADGTVSPYGFGWRLSALDGVPVCGHTGHWLGFSAAYLRVPSARLGIVLLANHAAPELDTEQIVQQLGAWLLGASD